jgi:hypothetical protein
MDEEVIRPELRIKMKYIGFIKEYNNIEGAKSLQEVIEHCSERADTMDIIAYVKAGTLAFAWMGYFSDIQTRGLIAPDSYYTDGFWVWPAYLPYYLSKYPKMYLDNDFVEYIRMKKYQINSDELSTMEIGRIENEISAKLNNGY